MLNKKRLEHGIRSFKHENVRGTVEIPEYKKQHRQADELAEQNA